MSAHVQFLDAGNAELSTRSGGRRPKSAKARNRGRRRGGALWGLATRIAGRCPCYGAPKSGSQSPLWVIFDRDDLVRHLCLSALPQKRPETVLEPHVVKGQQQTRALQHDQRNTRSISPCCLDLGTNTKTAVRRSL